MSGPRESLVSGRLLLAFASALLVTGITNAFPVFFPPLLAEFGGSRAATASTITLIWVGGAVLGPISGWAVVRWNPRASVSLGLLSATLGFALGSLSHSLTLFRLAVGVGVGVGVGLTGMVTQAALLADAYVVRRGAAMLTLGKRQLNSRSYVASFNLKGADQQKRIAELSGGERNRVHLAKLLKKGGNLLLLDEPTNDLDVDTLRALEEALLAFAGCVVVISHDRWFLDRIATHILAFEDEGRVIWSEGSYADYEADRKKRLGAEADRPHRLRYKRLK